MRGGRLSSSDVASLDLEIDEKCLFRAREDARLGPHPMHDEKSGDRRKDDDDTDDVAHAVHLP